MKKSIFDIGYVRTLEITDEMKKSVNRDFGEYTPTTAYRCVISFGANSNDLSEEEKALLDKLPENVREQQKEVILKNKTIIPYSLLLNAEDILGTEEKPFTTPQSGYSDEQQDQILAKVKQKWAELGNCSIFTLWEFDVLDLTKDTEYECSSVFTDDGTQMSTRSRVFVGAFADEATAFNMVRRSLITKLRDGDLYTTNPIAKKEVKNETPTLNL